MALNTNGWDYIYTTTIVKLNELISSSSIRGLLIDSTISGKAASLDFSMTGIECTKFEVLATSDYNVLDVAMTISGKYKDTTPTSIDTTFTDLVITFKLNIDWLNRYDNTVTGTDITFVGITGGTAIVASIAKLINIFKIYLNGTLTILNYSITRSATPSYLKYYDFFASLNPFGTSTDKNLEWMKMTANTDTTKNIGVQRFSAKKDIHKAGSGFFSFSCMIGSRKNNDPGYVDLNAIPDEATSALIIERSVFAEYMVKPVFTNANNDFLGNVFSDKDKKSKVEDQKRSTILEKSGAYAFTNSGYTELKSRDYLNENNEAVSGTVGPNRMLLSVEENSIKLSMGDVEYQYNKQNKPTINQEYVFNLKWENGKIGANGKEKLFIISNTYKTNEALDIAFNIGFPVVKNALVSIFSRWNNEYEPGRFIRIQGKPHRELPPRDRIITPHVPSATNNNQTNPLKPQPLAGPPKDSHTGMEMMPIPFKGADAGVNNSDQPFTSANIIKVTKKNLGERVVNSSKDQTNYHQHHNESSADLLVFDLDESLNVRQSYEGSYLRALQTKIRECKTTAFELRKLLPSNEKMSTGDKIKYTDWLDMAIEFEKKYDELTTKYPILLGTYNNKFQDFYNEGFKWNDDNKLIGQYGNIGSTDYFFNPNNKKFDEVKNKVKDKKIKDAINKMKKDLEGDGFKILRGFYITKKKSKTESRFNLLTIIAQINEIIKNLQKQVFEHNKTCESRGNYDLIIKELSDSWI